MPFSRQDASTIAADTYRRMSNLGPIHCDVEEIEAFVLGAKPAVLIFDWPNVPMEEIAPALRLLPFRHASVADPRPGGAIMLVNVDALLERVVRQPGFAADVGWNAEETPLENLSRGFGKEAFLGFALGFPERATRGFERHKRPWIRLPFARIRPVRFVTWLLYQCQLQILGRRTVEILNPSGYAVTQWVTFDDDPDPETDTIIEHARRAYARD